MADILSDVYMNKARYNPEDDVTVILESGGKGGVSVSVFLLDREIMSIKTEVTAGYNELSLGRFPSGGYGLRAGELETAFDVSLRSTDFPRYGFLSDFSAGDSDGHNDVKTLLKHHVNLVQFYDWMYRHHDLIPPADEFVDPLGRCLNLKTVREKISECRKYGMETMAYGAIYGAEHEYTDLHPDEIMYKNDGTPFSLIEFIYMMNYDLKCSWSDHIIGEFQKAVTEMGFDGIHLDQYGFPKFAVSKAKGCEGLFNAEKAFTPFINKTRERMNGLDGGENVKLIFNAVDNWPINEVAPSAQDCVYIEAWSPNDSYFHLRLMIDNARRESKKPVIISAYLKPFLPDGGCPPEEAEASLCLTNAVITANGANHLILGEEYGILQDAYYCHYGTLRDEFKPKVRRYFDFAVRYRDLLYDSTLEDVSMMYAGGIIGDMYIDGTPVSSDGRAGTVYISTRKNDRYKLINLINLLDQPDNLWNTCKRVPGKRSLKLVIAAEEAGSIFVCSPDSESTAMIAPEVRQIPHFNGIAYEIPVELETWTAIVITNTAQ